MIEWTDGRKQDQMRVQPCMEGSLLVSNAEML